MYECTPLVGMFLQGVSFTEFMTCVRDTKSTIMNKIACLLILLSLKKNLMVQEYLNCDKVIALKSGFVKSFDMYKFPTLIGMNLVCVCLFVCIGVSCI